MNKAYPFFILGIICLFSALVVFLGTSLGKNFNILNPLALPKVKQYIPKITSIDTMKFSRDPSREMLNNQSFDIVIDQQVSDISATGARYIAIGTPYDPEFLPILKRWVLAARKYKMKVWFRGNWSGWEGWFGYPRISRERHLTNTVHFILDNPDLFADGDIFSSCSECENGGPGDPRQTGDVIGHRAFLVAEYKATKRQFKNIHKDVLSNYFSMNGDVANLIMDRETTKALDGIVVVDHYVGAPEKLVQDAKILAQKSGGKIVLGEFGVPIPDIHGTMTEREQKDWLESALKQIFETNEIVGLNYWTSYGGSTKLWEDDGRPREAVQTISTYYHQNNR